MSIKRIISFVMCLAVVCSTAACSNLNDSDNDVTVAKVNVSVSPTETSDNSGEAQPSPTIGDVGNSENPAFTDPAFTNPYFTDPAFTDPYFTDPAFTDPYFTDPAFTDPASATPGYTATPGSSSTPVITVKPTATTEPTAKPTATPTAAPVTGHPYPTDANEIKLAEAGKKLMKKLKATPGYEKLNIKARKGYPYMILVNTAQNINTVTVYCIDEEGNYTRPYLSIVCSTGKDSSPTPLGIYNTQARYSWHTLAGPSYGQYCTRITGSYLFHSVPYYSTNKDDLENALYNQLGRRASLGCVRLPCSDAKWIYDNCPVGTTVVIYNDPTGSGPLGQPKAISVSGKKGWDPTDPDKANPFGTKYQAGYTIRSAIARADYDYAIAHGLWDKTINRLTLITPAPDATPTPKPTATPKPTESPKPTATPTAAPTSTPTSQPTDVPSPTPTQEPVTDSPTQPHDTDVPSEEPTSNP